MDITALDIAVKIHDACLELVHIGAMMWYDAVRPMKERKKGEEIKVMIHCRSTRKVMSRALMGTAPTVAIVGGKVGCIRSSRCQHCLAFCTVDSCIFWIRVRQLRRRSSTTLAVLGSVCVRIYPDSFAGNLVWSTNVRPCQGAAKPFLSRLINVLDDGLVPNWLLVQLL